jgi:pyrroloquinoline quinone biosynthesis protein B
VTRIAPVPRAPAGAATRRARAFPAAAVLAFALIHAWAIGAAVGGSASTGTAAQPAVEGAPSAAAPEVTAMVLGVAQDGGLPHLGCTRACCRAAREDPSRARRVAALGIVVRDGSRARLFTVDATPDFRSQVDSLQRAAPDAEARPSGANPLDGVFLTHAHIGHYTGLMYLGKESMAARGVPVWATPRMITFLEGNAPWRRLVEGGHVALSPLRFDEAVEPVTGLRVTPVRVPHRDEDSDTVGFVLAGPRRSLLYIPDVDAWEKWDRDIASVVSAADVSLIDGTFFGPGELPGRSMTEVPHPLIRSSMDRLEPAVRAGRRVLFIHLNHSNPALQADSAERAEILKRGFEVADDGMRIPL